jgi:hypothetical protein
MGNRPELTSTPLALAELSQNITKIGEHFAKQFEPLTKLGEQFAKQLEPLIKAGNKLKQQVSKALNKVKDFFQRILVKYLPLELPLFEIPRAQIQPSTGKVLQLPNSYRSHSPPNCSVIV